MSAMKKVLALGLLCALLCLSLVGCGSHSPAEDETSQTPPVEEPAPAEPAPEEPAPEETPTSEATLYIGMIDDDDVTWVNGQRIGETKGFTVKRTYTIPAGVLKAGKNELTVKIIDDHGGGGCYGPRRNA